MGPLNLCKITINNEKNEKISYPKSKKIVKNKARILIKGSHHSNVTKQVSRPIKHPITATMTNIPTCLSTRLVHACPLKAPPLLIFAQRFFSAWTRDSVYHSCPGRDVFHLRTSSALAVSSLVIDGSPRSKLTHT